MEVVLMRFKMLLFAVLLALLAVPAAAPARAHAAPIARVLTTSGPTGKGSDWTPEGKPQLGDPLTIPAGKTGIVKAPLQAGSITVEGELTGGANIETSGSIHFTHPLGWHEVIISNGIDQLNTGGTELATVENHGIVNLAAPLSVRADLVWQKATFDTNGYAVHVGGLAYPLHDSYSSYGTSTVTAAEWLDYNHEPAEDEWVEQFSSEATFIVNRAGSTVWKGAGWYYGTVALEGGVSTFSGDSYRVDTLRLNSPTITLEAGQTIEAEILTSNATAEHPVRVQSGTILGGPGGETTIDCDGCEVPPYVELVGVKVE